MFMRMHEERGMAMVVALLVSFAVLLLSSVVVAQSIHSSEATGYDRQRLESINAAEAGTNYWYEYLQTTPSASISCSAVTQTLGSGPATATFTATPTFYNSASPPAVMNCPFTDTSYPAYALINSTGRAAGQVPRNFQSYLRLTPNYGGFGAAILSNTGNVDITNNFDIYGNTGTNGDIYVLSGNYSQSSNSTVRGSVYVPNGSATMSNSSTISLDLWSLGSASVTTVGRDVTSTTGNIAGGTIGGNAKAAGTITGTVTGTNNPNQTGLSNPPTTTYPSITYNQADWIAAGYTINNFTNCTLARNFVEAGITGNQVVRIAGGAACTYANSNNATISVNGNLAIISDWGFDLSQQSTWNGVTSLRNLYFISTYATGLNCATASKNIVTGNNTSFNSLINVSFYSPCTTDMHNTSSFSGQVFGNPVMLSNQFTMTYQPVLVPGVTGIVGFSEDISYVREVV